MWIGHRKEIRKLTFRTLALRSDEGVSLKTSALESLYGGQFTLSTDKTKLSMFLVSLTKTRLLVITSSKLLSVAEIIGEFNPRLYCFSQWSVGNWGSVRSDLQCRRYHLSLGLWRSRQMDKPHGVTWPSTPSIGKLTAWLSWAWTGGGVLGSIFDVYVSVTYQNPNPIVVYSLAHYIPPS